MRIGSGLAAFALALGIGGASLAQEAGPMRFAMMAHPEGGIWVLDGAEGLVSRCRDGGAGVPRVIDVSYGIAVPRARDGAGRQPSCTEWTPVEAPRVVRPRVVGLAPAWTGGFE